MIKVLEPSVPTLVEVAPYLRAIDVNRWYSNSGPLVRELESRMGGVSVSSATLGLELAAKCVFGSGKVRIPALTFVATATALIRAGLEPVLCDVDDNWCLRDIDDRSLPVSPFGACVTPGPLVDAAAGWGNQLAGNRVYSLHATKALAAGEGGMVCGDPELLERVRRLANFGLEPTSAHQHGVVTEVGTNAKLSEYHAAVGLASLDRWPETIAKRQRLSRAYMERLEGVVSFQPNAGIQTQFPVLVDGAEAVSKALLADGIETRRWYTPTLDRHPAFAHLKREDLTNCHWLEGRVLCLPFHLHLTEADIDFVCDRLNRAV